MYEAEGMPYRGLHHGGGAVAQKVFGPIAEDVEGFAVIPEEFMGVRWNRRCGRPLYRDRQGDRGRRWTCPSSTSGIIRDGKPRAFSGSSSTR